MPRRNFLLVSFARTCDRDCEHGNLAADPSIGRREWTRSAFKWLIATTVGCYSTLGAPEPAVAAESGEYTIWKSGRAPIVPGQKPRDKDDIKGTRKDPNFLQSLADCKGKCENSPGSDGLARTKEECLTACEDICCTTYEQCTFAIVPQ